MEIEIPEMTMYCPRCLVWTVVDGIEFGKDLITIRCKTCGNTRMYLEKQSPKEHAPDKVRGESSDERGQARAESEGGESTEL